jgi:hypothetical protein
VLTEHYDLEARPGYSRIEPLEHVPTLFREFSAIPFRDRGAAIAFASKYGMLDAQEHATFHGHHLSHVEMAKAGFNSRNAGVIPCDPEVFWTEYPAHFRIMIRAWECSRPRRERLKELNGIFRWVNADVRGGRAWVCHPDSVVDDLPESSQRRIVYPPAGQEWFGLESPIGVASKFLRDQITFGAGLGSRPHQIQFDMESNAQDYIFRVRPGSLLPFLYIQLGQAIEGDKDHRRCTVCKKWFELVPQDKGRKEFCGSACKSKDYRGRKSEAVEMAAAGKTPKAIAAKTGANIETVKRWIKGAKKKDPKE